MQVRTLLVAARASISRSRQSMRLLSCSKVLSILMSNTMTDRRCVCRTQRPEGLFVLRLGLHASDCCVKSQPDVHVQAQRRHP